MFYAGDGHNHWHVKDLEGAVLTRTDNGVKVGTLAKIGFCFDDGGRYAALPGSPTSAVYTVYTVCAPGDPNALQVLMGLSVGWADTYPSNIAFQYIDVTNLVSGNYRLTATADPADLFIDADRSNNTTWLDLHLQIRAGKVTVIASGPHV